MQVKALELIQGNVLLWHWCSLVLQGTHSGYQQHVLRHCHVTAACDPSGENDADVCKLTSAALGAGEHTQAAHGMLTIGHAAAISSTMVLVQEKLDKQLETLQLSAQLGAQLGQTPALEALQDKAEGKKLVTLGKLTEGCHLQSRVRRMELSMHQ